MYDYVIIGSGFAGAVVARSVADLGKKVLIIEKRSHIGGNCYDENDENGILIHKYGPHIFHTNSEEVYTYLSKFTQWYDYSHEVEANLNGTFIPVPFNLNTLKIVYGEEKSERLREKLISEYGYGNRVPILKLRENTDEDIRNIADFVYENIFLKYTMKQWGQTPEQIDPAVTGRVPVLISEDNRYFQDKYQGMPLEGFTPLFEKMLDSENITVRLNGDAKDLLEFKEDGIYFENSKFLGNIIYTGAIDELFDCKYGRLPYRTLRFDMSYLDKEEYQPKAVINYTVSEDFTRITEFKKLTGQKSKGTTIMKEYPMEYTGGQDEIPYYAIANEENHRMYNRYTDIVKQYDNFYLLGRLAEYKYYNIDGIVEKALNLVKELEK
ncbi:MAG: UDP-galactopyranose mutase [Lachnospiraceae bacterium]|nr:UDP-galactopyranose mutase [Lachnospiraceae bacterium]